MTRWMGVGLVSAGVAIGAALAGLPQEDVVSAQGNWQCRSWALASKHTADADEELDTWLGAAARVEMTAAGLDVAGRYILVACRQ